MKKLYKLREWLTLTEAADQLSLMLSEPVTVAELYRLALDGHLTLSVNLVNHAKALLGRVVPYKDMPHYEALLPMERAQPGQEVWVLDGMSLDPVSKLSEETPFLCLEEGVVTIEGVWDLTMKGAERLDVEHAFQALTGGPPVSLGMLAGPLLGRPDGHWAQVQERLAGGDLALPTGESRHFAEQYIPAGTLPKDALLVVRTSALTEFHTKLLAPSSAPAADVSRLGTRERETLLKILIGMAMEGYKYVPASARSPVPTEIASDLDKVGLTVTDDTVRKYLKLAETTVLPKASGP